MNQYVAELKKYRHLHNLHITGFFCIFIKQLRVGPDFLYIMCDKKANFAAALRGRRSLICQDRTAPKTSSTSLLTGSTSSEIHISVGSD
jgi:hypothetical protein